MLLGFVFVGNIVVIIIIVFCIGVVRMGIGIRVRMRRCVGGMEGLGSVWVGMFGLSICNLKVKV